MEDLPVTEFEFHGERVKVTNHAIERFIERFSLISPNTTDQLKNPVRTIRRLLARVERCEFSEKIRLNRLLNNHCVEAEYWSHPETKLRFVMVNDRTENCRILVTIELPREIEEIVMRVRLRASS